MEGYLIRVPVQACFPEPRPTWRQKFDVSTPVRSRLLYYVVEEGYMRGYESPDAVDEPVESFQLTSHHIEVNAMYSLNIFELKARMANLPPSRQFIEDSSSDSSSGDDSDNESKRVTSATTDTPQIPLSSISPGVISGNYHVVFFTASKDLVKKWSVKLLNWNRFVFGSSEDLLDAEALKLAKDEITDALRAVNAANRFLRPVELRAPEHSATSMNAALEPATAASPLTPPKTNKITPPVQSAGVVKPSDSSAQPPNPWWVVPFGGPRRISSYSLRR
ncbi:hypothetical protein KRP22_003975 [Phytophthora ramorum]|uniref:uncharacterized protein n=1 Tax=Phytophthora ramorum TaxID=164328 RepID=UPI0030B09EF4|nr:hypothetical protein KRP23_8469 [Phytophthora ramorum]KAH7500661.1 hypothetical protein KRP22_9908 [Phytophthora ramorum]